MNKIVVYFTFILIINSVKGIEQLSSRIISLPLNTTQEITIYDNYDNRPPEWVRFITVAVHSQQFNISLFQTNNTNNSQKYSSITGRNIGLVLISDDDSGIVFINNNNTVDINVLIVTIAHKDNDPIPGGCNEEFPLQISPFLELHADKYLNRLEYQLANIGAPKGFKPLNCDKSQFLIKYDIYAYFLQANDFSEAEYFRAITLMSNESDIKQTAIHLLNTSLTRSYFYSYPGRGIVYNIIATSQQFSSAYIPIVTYDCDDFNQCAKLTIFGTIVALITGIVGLVVCLRGHHWFQLQMAFFGFISGSFIGYVLLLKFTSLNDTQISIYTLAIGSIASILWFAIWKIIHLPVISLILSGFSLGFVFVATILFTSIGNLQLFKNDINYWLIMSCAIFLITLFFLMVNAIVLSVVSTSIVGSYVAVVTIDRFIDGSLSYIVINVIKRALHNYNALNNVPFQNKDIVLSIMWILLSLTGITLQLYNSKDRNPFPPPSSCSHPHRDRTGRNRRRHYPIHTNEDIHTRRSLRTRRFNPMPSAPFTDNNHVNDERSPLLYPNINNLNNGNNFNYRSTPYHLSQNYNINGREYQSI